MHFFMIMNALMAWIVIWYFNVDLFSSEFLMIESSKVSNRKSLKTFKLVTITECWLKCKQTADCKDIGTVTVRNKRVITCYLLANDESQFEREEIFLKINQIHSVAVSSIRL